MDIDRFKGGIIFNWMNKNEIYNKYNVDPEDVSCLEQKTKGKNEITLITCTDDSKQRVIVKAKEV